AEDDVVALARADLYTLQADVADVMLRARVGAAGEMDVDGLIQLHGPVQVRAERDSLAFGVSRGPFATGVARAGDEAAENVRGFMVEADAHELALHGFDEAVRNVGQQKILPRRQADTGRAVILCEVREPPHL